MQLGPMRSWPKALVFLTILMGGLPSAAWAHAGHDHGVRPFLPVTAVIRATPTMCTRRAMALEHVALQRFGACAIFVGPVERVEAVGNGDKGPAAASPPDNGSPDQPAHQSDCCCGSMVCHAGIDIPAVDPTDHFTFTYRVELPPVLTMAGVMPAGIERPPRRRIAL